MAEADSPLERLFHEASALTPEQRAAFLDRECADDPALRERLETLLVHDAKVDGFLETPAARAEGRAHAGGSIPTRIGHRMSAATLFALIKVSPQRAGATGHQRPKDFGMMGAKSIVLRMPLEPLGQEVSQCQLRLCARRINGRHPR